jgi:hypothetical protein
MTIDISQFTRTLTKRSGEEESVRAALFVSFYSPRPLSALAPLGAEALRDYLATIPPGVLKSALVGDQIGPLTSQRAARDMRRLERPPSNSDFDQLYYSSSETGPPGDFGVTFLLEDLDDPLAHAATALLRFEFPWNFAEGATAENFLAVVCRLAAKIPFSVATAGFAFSHWHFDQYARDQVYSMLPRYIGFDHSAERPREHMRGRTPAATWLTLVDAPITAALGGESEMARLAPGAEVRRLPSGLLIRAAEFPPVGDVNRGATDLGEIPGVARWLKPLRVSVPFLGGSAVELDVGSWFSRFDELDNGPWNNR